MADGEGTHIGRDVNVTGGDFVAGNKIVYPPGSAPAELTPEQLAAAETLYRAQVAERYNRLGFAGLGVGNLRPSDMPLDDVFVRLTLTVEKVMREPIPLEEEPPSLTLPPLWGKGTGRRSGRAEAVEREDERRRERVVTTQESITLGDALTQHALIVGEPGAGKSTLLRWLAVTFAAGSQREADRLGPKSDAERLPLLVELGRLPEHYLKADSRETPNWKAFLPDYLTKQSAFDGILAALLEKALAAGRCLLLCDGLDEIADLSARRRIADSLADYARSSENRLVLSSRPAGVSGSEASLGFRFQRLTIQRFTPEDVRRFFGFLYALDSELTPDEQAKETDALFRAVESAPKTLELATTPLLATLLFSLWNENGYLPERRVELYALCCRMLIESWEAHHDVAYTGVLADIGWERHLRLLAPLAYTIHNTGQRTDAPAGELIPVLAQAMQEEGLAPPASATLEAEKFLRTLSLRSGLLQFLGADRYGFPHLTFQEYLAARHIAAQPDPDYIDLVMVDLHKAWWREVHLLVIGHLGSGSEGTQKVTRLLDLILHLYRPPWQVLRSQRFNRWIPRWLREFVNKYRKYRILQLPIYGFGIVVVLVSVPFLLAGNFLAARVKWQFERRLAWILAREFSLTVTGFFDFSPLGVNTRFCNDLANDAQRLLLQIVLDPGRMEDFDSSGLLRHAAAGTLRELGQVSEQVVSMLVVELLTSDLDARCVAADSLGLLGQASRDVVRALLVASGDSNWLVRQSAMSSLADLGKTPPDVVSTLAGESGDSFWRVLEAATRSLEQFGEASGDLVSALVASLGDSSWDVREAAARSLGALGQGSGEGVAEVQAGLMAALGDSDSGVREAAARSLGELGQGSGEAVAEVEAGLVAALGDSSVLVRQAAVWSLVSLRQGSGEVVARVQAGLMAALGDSSGLVRQAAVRTLVPLGQGSREVVEEVQTGLMAALNDSDFTVRQAAVWSLGELGQRSGDVTAEVLAGLVAALGDSDFYVREAAVWSLGELGQRSGEVVAGLVAALGDSDLSVRHAAAKSLGELGESSAEVVAALVASLGDSSAQMRQAAASSLVELGQASAEVVAALVAALGDSDSDVSQAAARSLGELEIDDETQLRTVLIALNRRLHDQNDDVRRAALTAIRRLLDGRQIPGYRWVPIRERREKARRRRIFWYWVLGISLAMLVAWVAAGLTTYLSLDEFWVRFVGALAALVALAAGAVQVLGWFRRPPWDR